MSRLGALGLALVLAGCLDGRPTEPAGPLPTGDEAELVPASASLEVGGVITMTLSSARPFRLESDDPSVAAVGAGGVVQALAPGVARIRAFTALGRSEARVTVVAPVASLDPLLRARGLTDVSLLGAWSASEAVSYAVGVEGVMLRTDDGGATWHRVELSVNPDFTGVWGSGPNDVFAVGSNGLVIHYDGTGWAVQPSGTSSLLLGVFGLGPDDVYAVGVNVALHYDGTTWSPMPGTEGTELWGIWADGPDDVFATGQNGVILRWDGERWSRMASPTPYILFGLWGTSAADVWAAGIRGTVLHYDGIDWRPVTVPSGGDFFALTGRSRSDLLIAGNAGLVLRYDGSVWSFLPQDATRENLRAITYTPGGVPRVAGWSGTVIRHGPSGWVRETGSASLLGSVAEPDGTVTIVGSAGLVLEGPAGGPWVRRPVPTTADLYGITRVAGGDLLAVGDRGTILWRRGGRWGIEGAPAPGLLRSVWADPADPERIVIVGEHGVILTRDHGAWRREASPTTGFLRHVHGAAADRIVAVGDSGTIVEYDGFRWSRAASPSNALLRGVWVGPGEAYAVGERGAALRYDGRRWLALPAPGPRALRAVWRAGPTEVYAVGEDGTMVRFDGSAWRRVAPESGGFLLGLSPGPLGSLIAVGANQTVVQLTR